MGIGHKKKMFTLAVSNQLELYLCVITHRREGGDNSSLLSFFLMDKGDLNQRLFKTLPNNDGYFHPHLFFYF